MNKLKKIINHLENFLFILIVVISLPLAIILNIFNLEILKWFGLSCIISSFPLILLLGLLIFAELITILYKQFKKWNRGQS